MQKLEFREILPFFLDCIKQLGCSDKDIKKQDFDVACRCPVCGDSRSRKNIKRLHLYQKGDVINVNCFNGDCSVKNLTPYNFFKEYNPRIFEQFKQFYKRKYLNEFTQHRTETHLDSWNADDSIFEVQEKIISSEVRSFVEQSIESFQFTGDDDYDLQKFKELVTNIKEIPEAYEYFKSLIN